MSERLKKRLLLVINILLPLTALIAIGASLSLWYGKLGPEVIQIDEIISRKISPETFSILLETQLLSVLSEYGIEEDNIAISEADTSLGDMRNVYDVKVPANSSLTLLNLIITTMTHEMGGRVFQGIEDTDGERLTIKIGVGRDPTDIITLRKIPGIQVAKAEMAIIVDDLGIKSLYLAERLCNIEQDITLSVLPFQHYTSEVVELATETGTPFILHMPMEPKSPSSNPGEGAVYTDDTESIIREKLARAFRNVRGAQGTNNHMGSKVTEDLRTMEIIMNYLSENDYFFVDSQTSRNSKGYPLSQKMGVKSAKLYSFIDVEDDSAFIEQRLDDLAQAAFDHGFVLAICHDRPTTVEILERKLPELEADGIKFVKIADIVR